MDTQEMTHDFKEGERLAYTTWVGSNSDYREVEVEVIVVKLGAKRVFIEHADGRQHWCEPRKLRRADFYPEKDKQRVSCANYDCGECEECLHFAELETRMEIEAAGEAFDYTVAEAELMQAQQLVIPAQVDSFLSGDVQSTPRGVAPSQETVTSYLYQQAQIDKLNARIQQLEALLSDAARSPGDGGR